MNTLTSETAREQIIREYLHAFTLGDVTGMLAHIHPAIHYERYIQGEVETVDNGAEKFRKFLERSAVGLNEHSLQLLQLERDDDCVSVGFRIITSQSYPSPEQPMKGHVVFWFMDDMILQLVVRLDVDHA